MSHPPSAYWQSFYVEEAMQFSKSDLNKFGEVANEVFVLAPMSRHQAADLHPVTFCFILICSVEQVYCSTKKLWLIVDKGVCALMSRNPTTSSCFGSLNTVGVCILAVLIRFCGAFFADSEPSQRVVNKGLCSSDSELGQKGLYGSTRHLDVAEDVFWKSKRCRWCRFRKCLIFVCPE